MTVEDGVLYQHLHEKTSGWKGIWFKSLPAASQIACWHYCAKNTRCLSINCKKYQKDLQGRCELNFAGLSNDLDDKYLMLAKGFVFSQIRCGEVKKRLDIFHLTKKKISKKEDIEKVAFFIALALALINYLLR